VDLAILGAHGAKLITIPLFRAFEEASGHRIGVSYGEAGELRHRIAEGAEFDATIQPSLELALPSGRLDAGSLVAVAHSDFGIGVRTGGPPPDAATPEALKRLLLSVASVVYTDPKTGGASGVLFARIIEALGIADAVNAKSKLVAGIRNAELVASGEIELAVQLSHEIHAVAGVQFVPLPAEFQSRVTFSAALSAKTPRREPAAALLRFLTAPEAAATIRGAGMVPG
jgi:molybdate transport system substrate-binding protein